jgi:hypothetical protein
VGGHLPVTAHKDLDYFDLPVPRYTSTLVCSSFNVKQG